MISYSSHKLRRQTKHIADACIRPKCCGNAAVCLIYSTPTSIYIPAMASTSSPTRVAIIGGGIGGLTLARILQLRQVPSLVFTLYEADANASLRGSFGGSLDLKRDSGQRAMREAGLHAEFLKLSRPVGGALRLLDDSGKILIETPGNPDDMYNPEIDRGHLRSLFLDSLESNTIQWGCKATSVEQDTTTGKYSIQFSSGKREGNFDIVVGADGAWSCVRSLAWPGVSPSYSGVTFLETKVNMKTYAELTSFVGENLMIAMNGGKGIIAQMSSNDMLTVYIAVRVSEDWSRTSPVALAGTPEEKIRLMLEHFEGWDESLRQLIRVGENPIVRPIYALPHDSQPRTKTDNVVLLGDAAHVMSPFAGAGVNMAMVDAADLADALTSGKSLETYEAVMRARANEAGKETAENLELFFSEDAAKKLTALFQGLLGL
ncbi:Chloride channel protein [Mycena indigotica]|uniref:Chloride channel protein n=1 Tax=Mycena indigotica TaxID=2126181 RepID=A0A8H6WEN1_9AGAR|nr:Chloride channel protein [Mycena indigotica]KAF7315869.1 Chloride channel protein [Mycena indigotica]